MTTKAAVIYHRIDLDGLCSREIVREYLATRPEETEVVVSIGYDYPDSIDRVLKALVDHPELDEIYLVDVCLPCDLLDQYAEKIIMIDHHDTGIERSKPYMHRFKRACVQLNHPKVMAANGVDVAHKAAACELAWVTFFPDKEMPNIVKLCGRYDVWDHLADGNALAFNEFCRDKNVTHCPEIFHLLFQAMKVNNLVTNELLMRNIDEGHQLLASLDKLNARDAKSGARAFLFGDTGIRVLVANQSGRNSKFFKSIYDKSLHDVMLLFGFNAKNMNWKISMFTENKVVDMQVIFDAVLSNENNEVLSFGGHMYSACGYSTTNIQVDLIQHLKPIED